MDSNGAFVFIEHSGQNGGVTRKDRTCVRRHLAQKILKKRSSEGQSYAECGPSSTPAKDASRILKSVPKSQSINNELCGYRTRSDEPKLDPPTVLPIFTGNCRDRQLIDYLSARLWPGFRQNPKQGHNPFSAYWLPRSFENPALYNSLLFGALCHQASRLTLVGRRPDIQDDVTRRQMKAIMATRAQINNCEKSISAEKMEDLLMTTICLATNVQGQEMLADRDPSPFSPVLTSGRWLDTYGAFACQNIHWNAVMQLLNVIGGVQNLKSFGLPWLISCAGLIAASTMLSPPPYPMLDVKGTPLKMKKYAEIGSGGDAWKSTRPCMGHGFRILEFLGLPKEVISTFASLGEFSSIMDAYCAGPMSKIDIDDILDSREVVMHSLLSLPPSIQVENPPFLETVWPTDERIIQNLYCACRLAAQLYGVMIIFPIPHSKGAREFAVSQIEQLLTFLPFFTNSHTLLGLDLWCTVIAGSSSLSYRQREWYRERAGQLSKLLDIRNWQELEEALSDFGWVPNVCNAAGYDFIRETDPSDQCDFL